MILRQNQKHFEDLFSQTWSHLAMHSIIKKIIEKLLSSADEKSKETFQRFFKNEVRFYGVRTPLVKKIAKECFKELNSLQKAKIFL